MEGKLVKTAAISSYLTEASKSHSKKFSNAQMASQALQPGCADCDHDGCTPSLQNDKAQCTVH